MALSVMSGQQYLETHKPLQLHITFTFTFTTFGGEYDLQFSKNPL